jgi:hypothetical protein
MSAEMWSKLLYTYGPNAVLIFSVFVIERRVRLTWKQANTNNKREQMLFQLLYGLTWIVIFSVAACSVYAWWQINVGRRPQIVGIIESLPNREILGTTFADLYLHKNPKCCGYSDYDLLLINKDQKPWSDGAKVKFTIQTPKQNSAEDDLYEYELSILSDFYRDGVVLRRRQNKLFVAHNGEEKELEGVRLSDTALPTSALIEAGWSLIPTAHAQMDQQNFSIYEFSLGLESSDAIVRRKTRYILSIQDPKVVLPWINEVLKDKASSYRLRLGVLVALNNMPNLPAQSLLPETITAIQNTLNHPDDTLRNEALSMAKKYNLIPVIVYEHANFVGRSQAYGTGVYRSDQSRLGSLPNDSASSVRVAEGFSVRLCENEGDGKGSGVCEIRAAGKYNLPWGPGRVADKVSFVQVFALKKRD